MKNKKFAPKSSIKKLQLNKMTISNFDTKKVKGGGWYSQFCGTRLFTQGGTTVQTC